MKKLYMATSLFVCMSLLVLFTYAQQISQLSFYSPLISTFDMKYTDNHLVVAQNGLLIFDVSKPLATPKLVAQTTYPGSYAYQIAVSSHYAYMAEGNNGIFAVYDISNFSAPTLKGYLPIPATSFYVPGDLEVRGNYGYLSGYDSLYVVDVSDATSPKIANVLPVAHTDFGGAEDVAVDQHILYVRTPFGVQVYDISTPDKPVWASTIPNTHTYNMGLTVDTTNHRVFLPWLTALQSHVGYDAYSVNNISAPEFLFRDSTEFGGGEFGIAAYSYLDTTLFISKGGGINAFNASPEGHRFVTAFSGEDVPNSSVSLEIKDSILYHAKRGGLEILKYGFNPLPVCSAPENLTEQVTGTTAVLRWGKVPGVLGYIFRYRALGTNDWITRPSRDNTAFISGLKPNTYYTWEVRSVCELARKGTSDWSLYNIFRTGTNHASDLITFAPNPVQQMLHVHIKDAAVTQIVITDLAGFPLLKLEHIKGDQNINCTSLQAGTYFMQLSDKHNQLLGTVKMIKR